MATLGAMSNTDVSLVEFLGDPLSPLTRTERRNLLIASTLGFLVSKAGLLPQQISALGITFSAPEQSVLLLVVAGAILYFLFAFATFGVPDFLIWRKKYQEYLEHVASDIENWSESDQHAYDELHARVPAIGWLYRASKPVVFIRLSFEYILPAAFALYVTLALAVKAYDP